MSTSTLLGHRDLELAATVAGPPDGTPVLFLHGGGQTRHAWTGVATSLAAKGWRSVAVDLRGHGDSEWDPEGDYTFDAFVGDVTALGRAIRPAPVIVGASIGGAAALAAVGEQSDPHFARALVLVDVGPRLEEVGVERVRSFMAAHLADGFRSVEEAADAVHAYSPHRPRTNDLDGLRRNLRRHPDGRWRWHWDPRFLPPPGIDMVHYLGGSGRLNAAARAVPVPTLVVRGARSDVLSEDGARELLGLLRFPSYVDVADAGHMVAGDRNDVFSSAVVGFLEALPEP